MGRIDRITTSNTMIDWNHHMVHEGKAFFMTRAATLLTTNVMNISFKTPAETTLKELHLWLEVRTGTAATFTILEDITSVANGTASIPYNHNRESDEVSAVTAPLTGSTPVTGDAIVPTGGTTILTASCGANGVFQAAPFRELILKPDSIYLFNLLQGAATGLASILLSWYSLKDRT